MSGKKATKAKPIDDEDLDLSGTESSDDEVPQPKQKATKGKTSSSKAKAKAASSDSDGDEDETPPPPKSKTPAKGKAKGTTDDTQYIAGRHPAVESDDEDAIPAAKGKKAAPAKGKAKAADSDDEGEEDSKPVKGKKSSLPPGIVIEEDAEDVFITVNDDVNKWEPLIVVDGAIENSFTKGSSTITWVTSSTYVLHPTTGKHLPIYFEMEEQIIWGISGCWKIGVEDSDKTLDNIEDFQICYPLTTLGTVAKPTAPEKHCKAVFDMMWRITVAAMKRECTKPKDKRVVPSPTYNSYIAAKESDDWTDAVKPLYAPSQTKDQKTGKKFIDPSKPEVAYIKFMTKGEGRKIRTSTKIYGPGNKPVSPFKYMSLPSTDKVSVRGKSKCVLFWDGIYWGAHGKQPHGASARPRVSEMNFVPVQGDSGPSRRMLGDNTAPAEADYDDDDAEFDDPRGKKGGKKTVESDFKKGKNVRELMGDSDDEEETPPVKGKAKPVTKGKAKPVESDEDDDEVETQAPPPKGKAKPAAKGKAKPVESDSDEDEIETPPVKAKPAAKGKAKPIESDSEDEDETPPPKTKGKGKK
jgi:hypothetical protein